MKCCSLSVSLSFVGMDDFKVKVIERKRDTQVFLKIILLCDFTERTIKDYFCLMT